MIATGYGEVNEWAKTHAIYRPDGARVTFRAMVRRTPYKDWRLDDQ